METKICSKCQIEKNLDEFNKRKNRKGETVLRGYCKKCHTEKSMFYAKKNPEKQKNNRIKWYNRNSKKLIVKLKKRRNSDILYKLRINIRTRVRQAIEGNFKKGKTINLLGTDIIGLKLYLESKFTEGMSWENYGLHGWHIDHIIPLSSAKTQEEFYLLCHHTNLQPLWCIDNLSKSDKILN